MKIYNGWQEFKKYDWKITFLSFERIEIGYEKSKAMYVLTIINFRFVFD